MARFGWTLGLLALVAQAACICSGNSNQRDETSIQLDIHAKKQLDSTNVINFFKNGLTTPSAISHLKQNAATSSNLSTKNRSSFLCRILQSLNFSSLSFPSKDGAGPSILKICLSDLFKTGPNPTKQTTTTYNLKQREKTMVSKTILRTESSNLQVIGSARSPVRPHLLKAMYATRSTQPPGISSNGNSRLARKEPRKTSSDHYSWRSNPTTTRYLPGTTRDPWRSLPPITRYLPSTTRDPWRSPPPITRYLPSTTRDPWRSTPSTTRYLPGTTRNPWRSIPPTTRLLPGTTRDPWRSIPPTTRYLPGTTRDPWRSTPPTTRYLPSTTRDPWRSTPPTRYLPGTTRDPWRSIPPTTRYLPGTTRDPWRSTPPTTRYLPSTARDPWRSTPSTTRYLPSTTREPWRSTPPTTRYLRSTTRDPWIRPWEMRSDLLDWKTTRDPWRYTWEWTTGWFDRWEPPTFPPFIDRSRSGSFQPVYFVVIAGVFVGGSALAILLRVCVLKCGAESAARRESEDVFLHPHPPPPRSGRYGAGAVPVAAVHVQHGDRFSATDKPPDYFAVTQRDGLLNQGYAAGNEAYLPVAIHGGVAPPPYESLAPGP